MTVIGIIGIIGTVEYVHAQTVLTIPEPDNFPEPEDIAPAIYYSTKRFLWYISDNGTLQIGTPDSEAYPSIGNLYINEERQSIEKHPELPELDNNDPDCLSSIHSVRWILDPSHNADNPVKNIAIPDNIKEQTNDTIIAAGFNFEYHTTPTEDNDCPTDLEATSKHPIFTKELRWTLYNQADKKAYHFSPRENILQAQPIPLCTTETIDTTTQTLKGDTKMCYGKHGDNMVIITKKLSGFYGATEEITTPTNPIDLDSNITQTKAYTELLKRLYLPAI